ncbi:MAG: phosphatidate cytidylyltransferase [Rhodanobacteraceae bacterium]
MKQRILTAVVVAPVTIALVLFLPSPPFALLTAGISLLALWEWTNLLGMRSIAARIVVLGFSAAILWLLWLARDGSSWWWIVIGLGVAWWLLALIWLGHFSFAVASTTANLAVKLAAGVLAVIPAWTALLQLHRQPVHGHAWALFALLLIWAADIAAYFAGSRYGSTRLAPRISPGKTTAGVWGALAGSASVALIGGLLFGARGGALIAVAAMALLAVAASVVGDLFESLIKRQARVKDSGTLFPGHGGLFDRLDSVFAALPVFTVCQTLLHLTLLP